MDKRGHVLLRRPWDATSISLKTDYAATCIAGSLDYWLAQLQSHISEDTSR